MGNRLGQAIIGVAFMTLSNVIPCAHAEVTVTFDKPQKYRDVGQRGTLANADGNMQDLAAYLKRLGDQYLPKDQSLRIEVLDIDLAGDERMGARTSGREVRTLTGRADWPSIGLRYVLEANGKEVDRREETVEDMNYLRRPLISSEKLGYEKRMLEQWFRERFAPPKAGKK
jgi:hypothetical protein